VRDHRREAPPPAEPTVRDHRGGDAPPAQPGQPVVRDHRGGADVRVHVEPPATQTVVVRHRGAPTTTYVQGGSTVHYHPGPPGPGFMLPMRLEVGNLSGPTDRGYLGGSSLRLGLHWASLSPRSVTYDVGVGLQLGWLLGPAEQAMSPDTKNVSMLGLYVEGAKVLHKGRFWRTWAGARGEYFARDAFGEDATGYGLSGRVSAELFADDSNSRPHGLFLGSYGFGMYLEANVRQLGDEVSPVQVGIGFTFRTPMVVL
jgi:hypothetical protein